MDENMNKLKVYDHLAKIKGFKKDPNVLESIRDQIYYKLRDKK